MTSIEDRIKIVMAGLSGREFAAKLGMSSSTVNQYLTGVRKPSIEFVVLICERFGVDAGWLLTGEGKEPAPPISPRAVALVDNFEALSEEDKCVFERLVSTVAKSGERVKKKAG